MFEMAITDPAALRLLREADADELHALIEPDRDHLAPWLAWAAAQTHADTVEFIARTRVQLTATVWDLNRVEIEAAVANSRSRAIPERLGYREEGTLREAERIGDHYLDSVLYAVLASEWPPADR
ncbi:MAG: GNAT family N-acetyltransferase [Thermoleophilia bacterium]|nr:GNAT family N-acetyltransferase [Thermoleophilia bacterium]